MVLGAGLMAHAQTSPGIRINEVVAENTTGLLDEDGTRQDWIELHNPLDTAVDLNGWHLSDDPARPAQWTFPPTPLPAPRASPPPRRRRPTPPPIPKHCYAYN